MITGTSICCLCFIFSVYATVDQIDLRKVSGNVELTDDISFNVTNRLECATICCKNVSSCGFFFSKDGRCQCLKEHGGSELWVGTLGIKTYAGCYHDEDKARILPHGYLRDTSGLTIDTCKLHCQGMNYIYFGTEAGRECYCGDVIKDGHPKQPETKCNTPCTGDRSTVCGGDWMISIYKIG